MNHIQADASKLALTSLFATLGSPLKWPLASPLASPIADLASSAPAAMSAEASQPAALLSPELHRKLALEQVAMHAVKLAVARWTIGDSAPDAPPASTRSRWYAQAHGDFTAWLSAGGFAQPDPQPVFSDDGLLDGEQPMAATAEPCHARLPAHPPRRCPPAANENSGQGPLFSCPVGHPLRELRRNRNSL